PAEHDAPYRRRQAHVPNQFAAEHAGSLRQLLDTAGARRPRRHEDGPVLQHRSDQAPHGPGPRPRHAAQLTVAPPRAAERGLAVTTPGGLLPMNLLPALCLLTGLIPPDAASRLAVIRQAPDFILSTQNGEPFRRSDLKGKVLLVSFIFTTCSGSC